MSNDELHQLVSRLTGRVARLEGSGRELDESRFPRIFPARQTADGAQTWEEVSVNDDGEIEARPDGRGSDDDDSDAAMVADPSVFGVIAVRTVDGTRFLRLTGNVVEFYLSAAEAGFGKYAAKSITNPPATVSPTTDFVTADLGEVAAEADLLILNLQECNDSTHALTDTGTGTPIGFGFETASVTDEATPRRVVVAFMIDGKNCT